MRILHITPTYLPATRYGGPIYSVHALCAALARVGHDVHVYTTNVDGAGHSNVPLASPVDLDGVKVAYFATGIGRRLYRSPEMARALDCSMTTFDVAHLHSVFLWPTSAGAVCARRSDIPYVVSPRGMLVADLIRRKSRLLKTAWIELFERRNIGRAAAIHLTSDIEEREFRAMGFASQQVAVVPNGMDLPIATMAKRPTEHASRVVLCLGRLNWKKGLDRLIAAMVFVPQARLILAGNDEEDYRPQLEQIAREHGVFERIEFVGPVHGDAKWQLIAAADVFALCSYSENFGNAALEAMACAVPVVVTPEVGLASTVASAGAGLVVEGQPRLIGAALNRLLADAEERRVMGERGRQVVADQFSWEAIAHAMSDVYAGCIEGRHDA